MKTLRQLSFIGMAIALMLTSCTIEKRVHMTGYNIEWNKSKQHLEKSELLSNDKAFEQNQTAKIEQSESAITALENSFVPPIIESTITANTDNSSIIISKQSASFQDKKVNVVSAKASSPSDEKTVIANKVGNSKKKTVKNVSAAGGKSQIVALLLCIFLGLLGIHRFYLGYTGMGVLYLFTAGIFGIGWIIDIILLIIPNGLTPKGKTSYKE